MNNASVAPEAASDTSSEATSSLDRRSKRLLLMSHCVLNQNAVVQPLARAEGAVRSAVEWAMDEGFGIIQLPCPEFAFLGPGRAPMTVAEYDTPEFHESNRRLLGPVIEELCRYRDAGYELSGALVISQSPSCDPTNGHWVRALLEAAEAAGLELGNLWQIPDSDSGDFDPSDPSCKPAGPIPVKVGPRPAKS